MNVCLFPKPTLFLLHPIVSDKTSLGLSFPSCKMKEPDLPHLPHSDWEDVGHMGWLWLAGARDSPAEQGGDRRLQSGFCPRQQCLLEHWPSAWQGTFPARAPDAPIGVQCSKPRSLRGLARAMQPTQL